MAIVEAERQDASTVRACEEATDVMAAQVSHARAVELDAGIAAQVDTQASLPWRPPPISIEEIRLLRIKDKVEDENAPLSFEMTVHDIKRAPAYKAISYVWGDEHQIQTILIDDRAVHVRRNCHYALWQAQLHFQHSHIWLDALCIDQTNAIEKGVHVGRMGQIYNKADVVLLCVGHHADESEALVTAHKDIGSYWSKIIRNPSRWGDRLREDWKHGYDTYKCKHFHTVSGIFLERSYFRRVWVYQELALARKRVLLVGKDQLSDSCFALIQELNFWGPQSTVARTLAIAQPNSVCFDDLVDYTEKLNCENVIDRLYGWLSLVDWQGLPAIVPDYGLTPFELALKIAHDFPDYDIRNTKQLLRMLEVDNSDKALVKLLAKRRYNHSAKRGVPLITKSEYACRGEEWPRPLQILKIKRSYDGRLHCPSMVYVDDRYEVRDRDRLGLYEALDEHPETAPFKLAMHPLYTSDGMAGWLPCDVRDGDFLIHPNVSSESRFWLVGRRLTQYIYTIRGQAVLIDGYKSRRGHRARFATNFTKEDILVLYAQDNLGIVFDSLATGADRGPYDAIARLVTSVKDLNAGTVPLMRLRKLEYVSFRGWEEDYNTGDWLDDLLDAEEDEDSFRSEQEMKLYEARFETWSSGDSASSGTDSEADDDFVSEISDRDQEPAATVCTQST